MKPAWDQLAEDYDGSSSVLIADVDCTSEEGKSVCSDKGVSGYPTIKYYTAETGTGGSAYSGGRSFEDLNSFVEETLKQDCDPKTKDNCNDQEKAYIDKMVEKGLEKWKTEASRLEGLASGQASADKSAWVQARLSILQLLSGTKKRKPKRMSFYTKIAIGIGCLVVVLVVVLYLCARSPEEKKKAKNEAPAAEKNEGEDKKDE